MATELHEEDKAYNAQMIVDIEREVLGTVERERLQKAPPWVRSVVTDLIRRLANSRAQLSEAREEIARRDLAFEQRISMLAEML
jgi:hypothetical protein